MRIRNLLSEKKISVREVQERLGLESPQAVYKWLHGTSLPALDNLLVLSHILGVRMEDILVWEETDGYPLEIGRRVLKETRERAEDMGQTGCADGAGRADRADHMDGTDGGERADRIRRLRRQERTVRLRHFPDLHAMLRWQQRARLTEELRRIVLSPRGNAGHGAVERITGEQGRGMLQRNRCRTDGHGRDRYGRDGKRSAGRYPAAIGHKAAGAGVLPLCERPAGL